MMGFDYFKLRSLASRHGLDPGCGQTRQALRAFVRGEPLSLQQLKHLACGAGLKVPIYDPKNGEPTGLVRSIGMNSAATKPLLVPVEEAATYLETHFRGSVGRGSGPKSEVMTEALEEARRAIGDFFNYDPNYHVVIFTPNTSTGMFLLMATAARDPQSFFVLSPASHHSAQLTARETGKYEYFSLNPNGTYDLNDVELKLSAASQSHHAVLCVESASNVTGYKNPIEEICILAARYNACVLIDHAQGAVSKKIALWTLPGRVFIAISGHKLYARDGSGAIVGPKEFFAGKAIIPAGGTITGVTSEKIFYAGPPHNYEPGTPAYVAQISLGKALIVLSQAGLLEIENEEERLTRLLMAGLLRVEGLDVLGEADLKIAPRGPVVSFTLRGNNGSKIPPGFVAKALEVFYGMDARPGQFCAHPFVYSLLGVSARDALAHAQVHATRGRAGCAALPGDQSFHASRLSFGFPTREDDLLAIPDMLRTVREMWPDSCALRLDPEAGEFYFPDRPRILTQGFFSLHPRG